MEVWNTVNGDATVLLPRQLTLGECMRVGESDTTGPIVVGIMYPGEWELRPREEFERDLAALKALDPRIEVLDVRYTESEQLRTQRGAKPNEDYRQLCPELTPQQRDAFGRVEIALAMDLPFDVSTVAPNLRWVQGMGAGASQLLSAGLGPAGIRLTNAAGVNAVSISEFVLARLLQQWKRLPEIDAMQRAHSWEPKYGKEIAGSTLGIVGFGAIGRQVALRARAFGIEVLATRASARTGDNDPAVDELFPADRLRDMLARCDAVVSAVPELATTRGLFGEVEFAAMPKGSLFINVGRGSAVDERALTNALTSGHLAGAAIDVASTEPLDASSALWEVPNLLISAHCSTSSDNFWANLHALFRSNLRHYLAGESLENQVVLDDEIALGEK
jgi:phosphoglycerate dehydrogenase-like enzyme